MGKGGAPPKNALGTAPLILGADVYGIQKSARRKLVRRVWDRGQRGEESRGGTGRYQRTCATGRGGRPADIRWESRPM